MFMYDEVLSDLCLTCRSCFIAAGGSLPVCAGCKQRIYDEQYLQALNTDWHTVCFRYSSPQTDQPQHVDE